MPRFKDGKHKGQPMGLVDEKYRGLNAKQVFDLLKQEQQSNGSGKGSGDGEGSDGEGDADGEGFDEHDWDGAREMTDGEKKELEREIDQAIRQGVMAHQKIAGTGAGDLDRDLLDLLEPKVDWREMLREFVKHHEIQLGLFQLSNELASVLLVPAVGTRSWHVVHYARTTNHQDARPKGEPRVTHQCDLRLLNFSFF